MPVLTENDHQDEGRESCSSLQSMAHKVYEFQSLRPCNLKTCTRSEIRDYFENTYDLDEAIFTAIIDEKYFNKCPDRLRLPLVFYFAHTATLYVNKLLLSGLIKERINRSFETMFETGVDEMSWDDTENYRMGGSYKWPSITEVFKYREAVREMVIHVIETAPLQLPITIDHPWWSLFMGMEHERIHLETSSVLLRQLPVEFLRCPVNWKYAPLTANTPAGSNEFVQIHEEEVIIGKPYDFPTYGWDNEYGIIKMQVPAFEATKYKITNRDFYEFVKIGGYGKRDLWTDEGWQWVQYRQAVHPPFWVCHKRCKSGCGSDLASYSHCTLDTSVTNGSTSNEDCIYRYRAIYDVIEMPWDWPVDVNYHEAKAYCTWKGPEYRLPTEGEYYRMRNEEPPTSDFECDPICSSEMNCNINLQYGSSTPVNFYPPNSLGIYDTCGNVWEWIEDHFNGLPDYQSNYLYDDFSSPCFDGRHTMIKGGSWISTGDEASRFSRFAFRRHFFQHLGFRMVRSLSNEPTPVRLCKAPAYVNNGSEFKVVGADPDQCYVSTTNIQMKYEEEDVCEKIVKKQMGIDVDYGRPLVSYCEKIISDSGITTSNAIVFGCGPGYTSFLLAKTFQNVVGVDYSGRLIAAANEFQSKGYSVWGEGEEKTTFNLPLEDVSTVVFKQLSWTPNEIEGYDIILFHSLDRLMEPKGWLLKLWECINPNGILVFSSSNKWKPAVLQEYIAEWFDLINEIVISNELVSSWQLKQD